MSDAKLCQWLRDNSSGTYRNSAAGADRIEELSGQVASLRGALSCILSANNNDAGGGFLTDGEKEAGMKAIKDSKGGEDEMDY